MILATPDAIPVTLPRVSTVAVPTALLLQVPVVLSSTSEITDATHTLSGPVIGAGDELTVMLTVVSQPNPDVYVIMAVPDDTPVTPPVPDTVAVLLVVLHVPPEVASVKFTLSPVHTDDGAVIAAGVGLTVTVYVA